MVVGVEVWEEDLDLRSGDRLVLRSVLPSIWVQIEAIASSPSMAMGGGSFSSLAVKIVRDRDARLLQLWRSTFGSGDQSWSSTCTKLVASRVGGAFSAALNLYRIASRHCSSSEDAVWLGSRGVTWAVHSSSSFGARRELGVMDDTTSSSCLYSDVSGSVLVTLAVYLSVEDVGAIPEMVSHLILVTEKLLLSGVLQVCNFLEPSIVLQVLLHMRKGIPSPVPHFSARLEFAGPGLCETDHDGHSLNVLLKGCFMVSDVLFSLYFGNRFQP